MSDTEQATQAAPEETGRIVDSVIQMKDFLPQREAMKWALNQAPGTVAWLGNIIGMVLSGEEKTKAWPDGKMTRSYQFNGAFEMVRYADNRRKTARSCYLPAAFADNLELVFKEYTRQNGTGANVSFSVEIGIEAVNRAMTPYAWRVMAYHKEQVDLLAAVRTLIPPRLGYRVQQAIARDEAAEQAGLPVDVEPEAVIIPPSGLVREQAEQAGAEGKSRNGRK
jgi:hypothetical protein